VFRGPNRGGYRAFIGVCGEVRGIYRGSSKAFRVFKL